jgi:hypothetical protein
MENCDRCMGKFMDMGNGKKVCMNCEKNDAANKQRIQ